MTSPFTGRTALVTGAGRGIGRAVALGLARQGAAVALLARSPDQLAETADLIRGLGGVTREIRADLGDPDDLARVAAELRAGARPFDILVNNAAVLGPVQPSAGVDPAEWAHALAVNVTAVATLTFALLPALLAQGWGRIVNVSSAAVARPLSMIGGNAYVTTKAALEAHTVNLAGELTGTGVTVNAFRPGSVDTAMQAWIRSQEPAAIGVRLHERFSQAYAEGNLITPERSAESLLARLAGEDTGQIWDVTDRPG